MNTKFKKLALAAAVSTGLAAASMPSHAIMQGAAGEAFLVPLVVWSLGNGAPNDPAVNTVVRLTIPSTLGFDTLPNVFTAQHTTPTNNNGVNIPPSGYPAPPTVIPTLFPKDGDLSATLPASGANCTSNSAVHWYWFDRRSNHRLDRCVPVSADDVVELNWRTESGAGYADRPGYLIIGTEIARTHAAANFAFHADAWLLLDNDFGGGRTWSTYIPAVPMNDGVDGAPTSLPSVEDNVKYGTSGVPREAAPLISGIRTNRSDGQLNDTVVFDLNLSNRAFGTLQVVWLDQNLAPNAPGLGFDDYNYDVFVNVFDTSERPCSSTVNLPHELNVIWVPPVGGAPLPPVWRTGQEALCLPNAGAAADSGFVTYFLPEYLDTNIDAPESAAVAFSLVAEPAIPGAGDTPNVLEVSTALAHERGTYK